MAAAVAQGFRRLAFGSGDFLQKAGVVLALRADEAQLLKEGHRLLDRAVEHQQPADRGRALA